MVGTLRGYALVNGFGWYNFFIWVASGFTCWSFPSYDPLTGTLGGTDGEVAFPNISARDLND